MNAREAAYLAVWHSFKDGRFASDLLSEWQSAADPSARDFNFAQEIAYGTIRMGLALDCLAKQLAARHALPAKLKEKVLLRTALYQFYYMDKVPLYAIADEMVALARKYCHGGFVGYLNALLRNLAKVPVSLPGGDGVEDLSTRLSYPPFFVKALMEDYGLSQAKVIMEAGNIAPPLMARSRKQPDLVKIIPPEEIASLSQSRDYYIQNITPVHFIANLCSRGFIPRRVLDLCASPGGKLIALHDHFPKARLYANDVTEEKVNRLRENLGKYGIEANLTCGRGEDYPSREMFDLIIIDAPCSNSGVLNKRPEARWRLFQESLSALEKTQLALIQKASALLEPGGEIWYMTCSILKAENEGVAGKACAAFGLRAGFQIAATPNKEGWDGGYACVLHLFEPKNGPTAVFRLNSSRADPLDRLG